MITLIVSLGLFTPSIAVEFTRQQTAYRVGYYLDCGVSPYLGIAAEMKQANAAVEEGRMTNAQREELFAQLLPMARATAHQNAERYQWVLETLRNTYKLNPSVLAQLQEHILMLKQTPTPDKSLTERAGDSTALLAAYFSRVKKNLEVSEEIEAAFLKILQSEEAWYYQMGSMGPFIAETLRVDLYTNNLQTIFTGLLSKRPVSLPALMRERLDGIASLVDDGVTYSERAQVITLLNQIHQTLAPDTGSFPTGDHIVPWPAGSDPNPWSKGDGKIQLA
ncbi:MAG: hypothetical protein ACYC7E_19475 [Armatimonadota bacterium]